LKILANILVPVVIGFLSGSSRYTAQNDPISGTWKGTYLCQVKSSPCHDEIAAYHASKLPGGKTYRFQMNKVVNGQEEEMGPLDFVYDDAAKTLTASNTGRVKGLWKFKLDGKKMHGTLTVGDSTLYRIIELHRVD